MSHRKLPDNAHVGPWTVDNFPFVDVAWIAKESGLAPSTVRRHITERNPRLVSDVKLPDGMKGYLFSRQRGLEWIEAYKSAAKLGRRGDGSKQRRAAKWEYEAELGEALREMGDEERREYSGYDPDEE